MKKRLVTILLATTLIASLCIGCGNKEDIRTESGINESAYSEITGFIEGVDDANTLTDLNPSNEPIAGTDTNADMSDEETIADTSISTPKSGDNGVTNASAGTNKSIQTNSNKVQNTTSNSNSSIPSEAKVEAGTNSDKSGTVTGTGNTNNVKDTSSSNTTSNTASNTTSGSTASNSGTTNTTVSNNSTSNSNSSPNSNKAEPITPATTPAHTHTWEEVTETNMVWVVDKEAWTETIITSAYWCGRCDIGIGGENGDDFTSVQAHVRTTKHSYYVKDFVNTVYHEEEGHYEEVTTVVGYKCSCGETK